MKKILVAGAGGAPSEGVIQSLLRSDLNFEVIGMGSEPTDLALSKAKRKYFVPYANDAKYEQRLMEIISRERPSLIHFQNDLEIFYASLLREKIKANGTKIFMPPHEVIDTCVHKFKTFLAFEQAGIKVPRNVLISNVNDLRNAFSQLADHRGRIWLRSASIGGGGKGALPANNFELAKAWIDFQSGWGDFIAAEMLTDKSITWLSIWHDGKLVVAQTRERRGWTHGNRSPSGVTGVTKVGVTTTSPLATEIGIASVHAVSKMPHGIFGVDMTMDASGVPNPTEINISRFFTTVLFFTEAGLNLPEIMVSLALDKTMPALERTINPLPDNLIWLRGMDVQPRLTTMEQMNSEIIFE